MLYKRHPDNANLSLLIGQVEWNGLPIYKPASGMVIENYLCSIHSVIQRACAEHTRVFVLRFDLRLPQKGQGRTDHSIITRFIDSLKNKLFADQARKRRAGLRVYTCRLRYMWVREKYGSSSFHYHVAILLNHDTYFTVGRIGEPIHNERQMTLREGEPVRQNMFTRINAAWASALGISLAAVKGLVHIPENATYKLDQNSAAFWQQLNKVFYRLSYFAKAETKKYEDGNRHFDCSRS